MRGGEALAAVINGDTVGRNLHAGGIHFEFVAVALSA